MKKSDSVLLFETNLETKFTTGVWMSSIDERFKTNDINSLFCNDKTFDKHSIRSFTGFQTAFLVTLDMNVM